MADQPLIDLFSQCSIQPQNIISSENNQMFTPFSQLPAELRLKIWRVTLPGPRVVVARYDKGHACTSMTKIPTSLLVNRESREEAKRFYKLSFGGNEKLPDQEAKVWFDSSIDLLYIDGSLGGPVEGRNGYTASMLALRSVFRNISDLEDVKALGMKADFLFWFCARTASLEVFQNFSGIIEAYIVDLELDVLPAREESLAVTLLPSEAVDRRFADLKTLRDDTGVHWKPATLGRKI